jgi:predicted esterase
LKALALRAGLGLGLGAGAASFVHCGASSEPLPQPDWPLSRPAPPRAAQLLPAAELRSQPLREAEPASDDVAQTATPSEAAAADANLLEAGAGDAASAEQLDTGHCAGVAPLGPDGTPPPAPPHAPLGEDWDVPGDRPVYVLPGEPGDPRVIVYLHGMCGDVTAADYFREAVRAHGTLVALRGDTPCAGDRFKWRDDPSRIQERLRAALALVEAKRGSALMRSSMLLFGYSQGAERAEKLAAHFPKLYPHVVLGGPPMRASANRLARAARVAILGGELETTENMRAGVEALTLAGVRARYFALDCAYHGYYGSNAETQLSEVLDWVSAP